MTDLKVGLGILCLVIAIFMARSQILLFLGGCLYIFGKLTEHWPWRGITIALLVIMGFSLLFLM